MIGNKEEHKQARKLYKSLGIPEHMPNNEKVTLFDVTKRPYEMQGWNTYLSPRNKGKTTSLLILALCYNWLYGYTFAYIRTLQNMTVEKSMITLFGVINDYKDKDGRNYIQKITNNTWNRVVFKRNTKKFYYANVDEQGNIIEQSDKILGHVLAVELQDVYKSSFADTNCNILIYDEFIDTYYRSWTYEYLMNLISTVKRSREALIFLSANTLDRDYPIFYDFDLIDIVRELQLGEHEVLETPLGTRLWLEIVAIDEHHADKPPITEDIRKYFGFSSKKLEGITGLNWSYKEYPHAPKQTEDFKRFESDENIYLQYYQNKLQLELCMYQGAPYLFVHRFTGDYRGDYIVYTNSIVIDSHYRYGFGTGNKLDKIIWKLALDGRVFFGDNRTGSIFNKYLVETDKNAFSNY